jgi:hypothetical protein
MSITKARKLTLVRKPSEPPCLEPGEAVHVGVDVHKASYSVALFGDRRGLIATWVQPARPEVLLERLRPLREGVAQVVYAAGPTGFTLARRLRAEGLEARVIAPSKLLAPVGPEAKGDRLDCRRPGVPRASGVQLVRRPGPGRLRGPSIGRCATNAGAGGWSPHPLPCREHGRALRGPWRPRRARWP